MFTVLPLQSIVKLFYFVHYLYHTRDQECASQYFLISIQIFHAIENIVLTYEPPIPPSIEGGSKGGLILRSRMRFAILSDIH